MGVGGSIGFVQAVAGAGEEVQVQLQRQSFIDDWVVASACNVERVLGRPIEVGLCLR